MKMKMNNKFMLNNKNKYFVTVSLFTASKMDKIFWCYKYDKELLYSELLEASEEYGNQIYDAIAKSVFEVELESQSALEEDDLIYVYSCNLPGETLDIISRAADGILTQKKSQLTRFICRRML